MKEYLILLVLLPMTLAWQPECNDDQLDMLYPEYSNNAQYYNCSVACSPALETCSIVNGEQYVFVFVYQECVPAAQWLPSPNQNTIYSGTSTCPGATPSVTTTTPKPPTVTSTVRTSTLKTTTLKTTTTKPPTVTTTPKPPTVTTTPTTIPQPVTPPLTPPQPGTTDDQPPGPPPTGAGITPPTPDPTPPKIPYVTPPGGTTEGGAPQPPTENAGPPSGPPPQP